MNSPSPSSGFSIRRGCTAAAVGLRVIHQHMTDRFRRVEDHGGAPEDAADDHLVLVGSLRPNPQIVGAHQRQELTRREVLRSGIRMRRDEGPNVLGRDGCLHRPCFTTFSLHGREAGGASWKEGTIHTTARTKPSHYGNRGLAEASSVRIGCQETTSEVGDYSPDPNASRFPDWPQTPNPKARLSEIWAAYVEEVKPAASTQRRWKGGPGPGKDAYRELDPKPGIREQPRSGSEIRSLAGTSDVPVQS
jgi:hypothetical protein